MLHAEAAGALSWMIVATFASALERRHKIGELTKTEQFWINRNRQRLQTECENLIHGMANNFPIASRSIKYWIQVSAPCSISIGKLNQNFLRSHTTLCVLSKAVASQRWQIKRTENDFTIFGCCGKFLHAAQVQNQACGEHFFGSTNVSV